MISFETLARGLVFPEGPVALPGGGVLCVEVLGGRLTQVVDARRVIANLGGGPNGAALGPDGRCYVCNNGGLSEADIARLAAGDDSNRSEPGGTIQAVDLGTGEFHVLYDSCGDGALLSPNDLVFDAKGGFYFTDYGSVKRASPQAGRIYYARADGSAIHPVGDPLERPNGIGLSPDGRSLYVSETSTGRLWMLPLDNPRAKQLVFEDASLPMDSMAVQQNGSVCIACPHDDIILRISPDGSAEKIPTPEGSPSNICFGGPGLRTAYITMLRSGALLAAAWDSPGLQLHACPDGG
jgi:gluconolactonase